MASDNRVEPTSQGPYSGDPVVFVTCEKCRMPCVVRLSGPKNFFTIGACLAVIFYYSTSYQRVFFGKLKRGYLEN